MEQSKLNDAVIQSIEELSRRAGSAGEKLVIKQLNDYQNVLIDVDGEYDIVPRSLRVDRLELTSVSAVIPYIAQAPWSRWLVEIESGGLIVTGWPELESHLGLQKTVVKFNDSHLPPFGQLMRADEMGYLIKTSRLRQQMFDADIVAERLGQIKWMTTFDAAHGAKGADKSNYGSFVSAEATVGEKRDEAKFENISLTLHAFCDFSIPVTDEVKCFFRFDHPTKSVALVPYGGELERLRLRTYEWIEGELHHLVDQMEDMSTDAGAGGKVVTIVRAGDTC